VLDGLSEMLLFPLGWFAYGPAFTNYLEWGTLFYTVLLVVQMGKFINDIHTNVSEKIL
jgi:hypothetical protein